MTSGLKRSVLLIPFLASLFLAGCVSQSRYDYLEGQFKQLQDAQSASARQNSADREQIASMQKEISGDEQHISRLQEAIKYTVNSDLLFPSGSWKMSPSGQQLIAKLAPKLAPYQEMKLYVNGYTDNASIGPALRKEGITSNEMLSQKRAEAVMQYLISKGVKPDLVSAHGYGEADPVAPNYTPSGRAQNRRVELTLSAP